MSKIEKSKKLLEKTRRSRFVTIMLTKSFFDQKKCDDNFFIFLRKKLKAFFLLVKYTNES